MRLQGKTAIVTAAASGIGKAGAIRFAREGAKVGVVDIDGDGVASLVDTIARAGGTAHAIVADLSRDEDSERIVEETVRALGGLDIVWCHAGHVATAAFEQLDLEDFDSAMDLNLRSALVTTKAAIPRIRANGGGSILLTSSVSGIVGSAFSPVYSAGKFALNGLMKSLALRLAPEGIRINSICPGDIDTPTLRAALARPGQERPVSLEANLESIGDSIPMRRLGSPEEVANAALFLVSDEASYITGVALAVDGGFTAR